MGARSHWEEETRREVRIERALREHESVGVEDGRRVTERAKVVRFWSSVSLVGLLVLGAAALGLVEDRPGLSLGEELAWSAAVIGAFAWLLVFAWWRRRLAVRWPADPLPHEAGAP